jgi:hypothetical protein
MAEEVKEMSESEKKKEDWMNSKWRPAMGWMYMLTCMTDFVLFPILWSLLQAVMHVPQITQWQPLTLQGAGLFHIAMGAVLGIAAMGRTQEKLAGANNGGAGGSTPAPGGFSAPAGGFSAPSFGSPAPVAPSAPSFGGGFGSPAPSAPSFGGGFGGGIATTASGKKIVPQEDQPLQ